MKLVEKIALSLIISIFIGLSVYCALQESLTFDEIVHRQEGLNALRTGSFAIEMNNPPMVRNLAMMPEFLGFYYKQSPGNLSAFYGRVVVIIIGSIGLLCIYALAKRFVGIDGALEVCLPG
jgi:hypothetical protein